MNAVIIPPEAIPEIVELSMHIKASNRFDALATALALAQGQIEHAGKTSVNPHFKSKYADLAEVWDACRKPLSDNKLSIIQAPSAKGAEVSISTMLMHSSGQFIISALTMLARDAGPQAIGSCITYGRRYSLMAIVGVAPDDDDGNAANGRPLSDEEKRKQDEDKKKQYVMSVLVKAGVNKKIWKDVWNSVKHVEMLNIESAIAKSITGG